MQRSARGSLTRSRRWQRSQLKVMDNWFPFSLGVHTLARNADRRSASAARPLLSVPLLQPVRPDSNAGPLQLLLRDDLRELHADPLFVLPQILFAEDS